MNNSRYGDSQFFEAFIRLDQYFVRLKTQQDLWDHLGKFIMTYFPADWIVFARRDSVKGVSILYCTLPDEAATQRILTDEARALITDVLDSGFLASQVILRPAPSMTVFLPIVEEYRTEYVMLIGHKTADPIPNELLNIYLAIAGLAGTTFERLHNELELNRYRSHLEELVKDRTAELTKTKRQNELILHSVGEGICGVDMDGNITFVNPFAAQMIGWDPSDLIGRNAHATFHHTGLNGCKYPAEKCPVQSALMDGETKYATNEEFWRKDGTHFPVEFTTAPLMENDKITGAVIVFRDITERQRAEKELQQKQEELEVQAEELQVQTEELSANNEELEKQVRERKRAETALQEAKSQAELYLDLMGHDISNMHQIAMGQLELVQIIISEEGKLDSKNIELIDSSIMTLERSARLIDNVRKLQKIKAGEYNTETMDICNILAEVIEEHSNIPEKDITFNYAPVSCCYVNANHLLKDVFTNIVGNAIKHSNGTIMINVDVREVKENGIAFYRVAIEDNGPGIPDESKQVVFHRLKRGETKTKGAGLGLYIVKTLLEGFNGHIRLEDRIPGDHTKGSRFIVYLPVAE